MNKTVRPKVVFLDDLPTEIKTPLKRACASEGVKVLEASKLLGKRNYTFSPALAKLEVLESLTLAQIACHPEVLCGLLKKPRRTHFHYDFLVLPPDQPQRKRKRRRKTKTRVVRLEKKLGSVDLTHDHEIARREVTRRHNVFCHTGISSTSIVRDTK